VQIAVARADEYRRIADLDVVGSVQDWRRS